MRVNHCFTNPLAPLSIAALLKGSGSVISTLFNEKNGGTLCSCLSPLISLVKQNDIKSIISVQKNAATENDFEFEEREISSKYDCSHPAVANIASGLISGSDPGFQQNGRSDNRIKVGVIDLNTGFQCVVNNDPYGSQIQTKHIQNIQLGNQKIPAYLRSQHNTDKGAAQEHFNKHLKSQCLNKRSWTDVFLLIAYYCRN